MESARSSAASDAPSALEQRLSSAETRRQAGNTKFRAGDTAAARDEYEEALKLLRRDKFEEAEEDLISQVTACRLPAQLNLALCCLKAEPTEAHRALELCEEVLEVEPDNPKATFRKGRALVELGEYAEAEYEFVRAVKLAPGDLQIRKDLESLRLHIRAEREVEKKAYAGVFSGKDAGFMSEGRNNSTLASEQPPSTLDACNYDFICDPNDNPFLRVERPNEEAYKLADAGRLEEAIFAWEAAVQQTAAQADSALHFSSWLELGRVFMDLNYVDALALRCINKAAGFDDSIGMAPPIVVQKHALLLRAVCLLNEAESDTLGEVSACLAKWLDASGAGPSPQGESVEALEQRMELWRQTAGIAVADAAVAHGLLHILHQREEALQAFGEALVAPVDEGSCFGGVARYAVRWNMLGAVLANRSHHTEALVAFGEALRLQPHYPRALTNRGISHQAGADGQAAASAFTQALELVPDWGSPVLWDLVRKATEGMTGPEIAEAVEQKSVVGLRKIFGNTPAVALPAAAPIKDILTRIGVTV